MLYLHHICAIWQTGANATVTTHLFSLESREKCHLCDVFIAGEKVLQIFVYTLHLLNRTKTNLRKCGHYRLCLQCKYNAKLKFELKQMSPRLCKCGLYVTIGLLQLAITWYKIRHTGGQAHYYSPTGTLKQGDLNQ